MPFRANLASCGRSFPIEPDPSLHVVGRGGERDGGCGCGAPSAAGLALVNFIVQRASTSFGAALAG